jgi:anti-sigma regulatory factor (Ser/Thr protein kinase)
MAAGRPPRPPDVDLAFDHEGDAPRRARRAIRKLVDDPTDPIAEAVTLSASELVTNAINHTPDGGELRAWDRAPDVPLRLEVEDHDPTLPEVRTPQLDATGGRGLHLVDDVANDWGVEPTPEGKIVWAEFDRTDPRT